MKNYINNKVSGLLGALCLLGAFCVTSCEDMLDKGNDYVIYADDQNLANAADTVSSIYGIWTQLQAIAVRTNLLGELRADLVTVRDNAVSDLKDIAAMTISDDNAYNLPTDYYGVINSCNFFLAHADSTAGDAKNNKLYFAAEIAQAHSIRAWTYLQLVLNYGRVPFLTEPIVSKQASEQDYPMATLDEVCDYFIEDLKPYYGKPFPQYHTNSDALGVDPRMCCFPTQVVMGDLYLWKAVRQHDPEMAKQAAKCYADYIVWTENGKSELTTSTQDMHWAVGNNANVTGWSSTLTYSTTGRWGLSNSSTVTVIPMDSLSTDKSYNQLRALYCYDYDNLKEASIEPSTALKELSRAQTYVAISNDKPVVIDNAKISEWIEENEDYQGDLRLARVYEKYSRVDGQSRKEVNYQTIRKHYGVSQRHVTVYRTQQIYLRLAEALNYAGYPRFARQILTMGLSNLVITAEVLPYYTSDADQEFLSYFDFSNARGFYAWAQTYTPIPGVKKKYYDAESGNITESTLYSIGYTPVKRANDSYTVWGIHSRGSGYAFYDENYVPLLTPDSTDFPRAELDAIGELPTKDDPKYEWPTKPKSSDKPKEPKVVDKPSTWDLYPNQKVDKDIYVALALSQHWVDSRGREYTQSQLETRYTNYYIKNDSVGKYNTYITVTLPQYESDLAAYDAKVAEYEEKTAEVQAEMDADVLAYYDRIYDFQAVYQQWNSEVYSRETSQGQSLIEKEQEIVDQAILDEQALELAFEGNRFYDLMRRAYWYNDNSRLATPVSKRDATAGAKLLDRNNWFLNWKGKIGM